MSFWGLLLPTTPMAMKIGISWIVYTIVCAKRKEQMFYEEMCHQLLATQT